MGSRRISHALLRAVAFGSVLAAPLVVTDARAQTSAAERAGATDVGIPEIIVTAQKREESSLKVGLSIVSVSGEALAERKITDAADLVRVVPGFSYGYTGLNTPVYSIRGVGFNDSSLAASPTVSVYVDQVSLPYSAMTQGAMFDIERLEVLKGPQGTLFGQNSTGGAINLIANKPKDHLEAGGSISYGRFNDTQMEGYVSGPLSRDFRARLAVTREVADGWQKSLTRNDSLGKTDRGAARLLLDWDASANLKISFNANGWFDKSDTQAGQLVAVVFGNANPVNQLASVSNAPIAPNNDRMADWNPMRKLQRNDHFFQSSLRADWSLGEVATLTSISAFNQYFTKSAADADGIAAGDGDFSLDGAVHAVNQELRLSGDAKLLHWLVGGSYARDNVRDNQPLQDYPASSGSQSLVGVYLPRGAAVGRQRITTKAAFANGEVQLIDQVKVVGGVRYTAEDRDFQGCAVGLAGDGSLGAGGASSNGGGAFAYGRLANALAGLPLTSPNPTYVNGGCVTIGPAPTNNATLIKASLNEHNVSWNTGVNFAPAEGALLYGRLAKGYKSGSFPTLAYVTVAQGLPVVQESLMSYETGFKKSLFDRQLIVEGALFYYDYTNKQVKSKRFFTEVSSSLNALNNVPKSWVKGAELSLTAQPVQGLTLTGAVNYLDTKITQFTGFSALGNPPATNLSGSELNYSPHWQLQAGAVYDWTLTPTLHASLGVDVSHRSLATAGIGVQLVSGGRDTRFDLPAYTLVDLRAAIHDADDHWSLSIWGKNVTNQFYVTNAFRAIDTVVRFTGRPATFGATVGVKY